MKFPLISSLIFLPILFSIFLLPIKSRSNRFYYIYSISASLISFIISVVLLCSFNKNIKDFQFIEQFEIFNANSVFKYIVGVDGLSLSMIILTTLLTPICLLISANSIKERVKEYVICFLMIQALVIGSFASLDIIFFYIFFESMLIPMFFVIGIWGGENRIYASYKFFLYTLFGSLFFLIAIIFIYLNFESTNIIYLSRVLPLLQIEKQNLLFLAFFISFAIKIPMFPFHTWLPDAHVQAPTSGSVMLAGVLIKLGAYGLIRFSLPFFPDASHFYSNYILILSAIAIIYASLVSLAQEDIKKMIAYSSVAHMGFVTMGIFSFTKQGLDGAVMQMISHGVISAALFLCVGVIYNRIHTKKIKDMGGIANKMPNFAMFAMIFTLASIGLPGTSGFVGEFLVIIGAFQSNKIIGIISAIGVILGACYMLWLYKRVWFGEITNDKIQNLKDIDKIELFSLLTMATIVILLGLFPNLLLGLISYGIEVFPK